MDKAKCPICGNVHNYVLYKGSPIWFCGGLHPKQIEVLEKCVDPETVELMKNGDWDLEKESNG